MSAEGESRLDQNKLTGKEPAKTDPKANVPVTASLAQTESQMRMSMTSLKSGDEINDALAIYERAVLIIPYKSPDFVKQIEGSFEQINLVGLGVDNIRYLNTKEFSEEEKKNRKMDILGGFELMDTEHRIYIIEGLGGSGRGMD